jgi:hypothetical protein
MKKKEIEMTNLEWLKKMKKEDIKYPLYDEDITETQYRIRIMKATEIIAEQIINLDNTLACIVSTLENIETAIKQGG